MLEAEAKARNGKRVITLKELDGVPKGTTGIITNPRPLEMAASKFMGSGGGGHILAPPDEWVVDIQFDDPAKTTAPLYEWDESSLKEI